MLVFLFAAVLALELPIGVIVSPHTEPATLFSFNENQKGICIYMKQVLSLDFELRIYQERIDLLSELDETNWRIPSVFLDKHVVVVVDATNDLHYGQFLKYMAVTENYLHIVYGRPIRHFEGEIPSLNCLYIETSLKSQAFAFIDIVEKYN